MIRLMDHTYQEWPQGDDEAPLANFNSLPWKANYKKNRGKVFTSTRTNDLQNNAEDLSIGSKRVTSIVIRFRRLR